jgi:two-component system, NarL family, invasion response regulator UvrY
MYRFLIADDHAVVRRGLTQILLDAFPFSFIAEATDAEEMLDKIKKETWDLVICDISMPGRSGLDVMQEISNDHPKLPVLILSFYPEAQFAIRILKAGASAYLTKDTESEILLKAIHQLLLGKKYITSSIAEKLATMLNHNSHQVPHEYLSNREFEVMKELAAGKSVSQIADKISLSVSAVSTYRSRIMAKMNLKTNADLILYSIEHRII